jgi:hypothetical protein
MALAKTKADERAVREVRALVREHLRGRFKTPKASAAFGKLCMIREHSPSHAARVEACIRIDQLQWPKLKRRIAMNLEGAAIRLATRGQAEK